jgi:hypothetical protein
MRPPWSKNGVPIGTVRPLAQWLVRQYGFDPALERVGIAKGSFTTITYGRKRVNVNPAHALRIATVVSESRPARRTFFTDEAQPRRIGVTQKAKPGAPPKEALLVSPVPLQRLATQHIDNVIEFCARNAWAGQWDPKTLERIVYRLPFAKTVSIDTADRLCMVFGTTLDQEYGPMEETA